MSVASIAMFIGVLINISNGVDLGWRLWLGLLLHVITAVCCVVDIIKNNNPRKIFWIISFIILWGISSFVYLIQRKNDE